jgi:hypothetical protein
MEPKITLKKKPKGKSPFWFIKEKDNDEKNKNL